MMAFFSPAYIGPENNRQLLFGGYFFFFNICQRIDLMSMSEIPDVVTPHQRGSTKFVGQV